MFVGCDEYLSGRFHLIGSVWTDANKLHELEKKISKIRYEHKIWGEAKWEKITYATKDFYLDFLKCFLEEKDIFYNCLIFDSSKMNYGKYSNGDRELGFYKFCYLLINNNALYIKNSKVLHVLFDKVELGDRTRYPELQRILQKQGYKVSHLGPCDSKINSAVQIADLITGAIGASWNNTPMQNHCLAVVDLLEKSTRAKLTISNGPPPSFGYWKINKWLFAAR